MTEQEREIIAAGQRLKEAEEGPLPGECLDDIDPEAMKWLWKGRIKHQALTTFASDPGVGKGTFLHCLLVPRITKGVPTWPDGEQNMLSGSRHVIIVGDEDNWKQTVRPRLDLVGVDRKFVRCVGISAIFKNWPAWERLQRELNPGLWIVDPFDQMITEPKNNSMGGWGQAMAPYKDFVAKHDTSIIGVMHMTKAKDGKSATNLSGGSIKFAASTRGSYNMLWSPAADNDLRLVVPGKPQNNAKRPSNMSFRVQPPAREDVERVLAMEKYRVKGLTFQQLSDVWVMTDLNCNAGMETSEEIIASTSRGKSDSIAEEYVLRSLEGGSRNVYDVIDSRPAQVGERAVRTAARKLGVIVTKGPKGSWTLPAMPDEETTL